MDVVIAAVANEADIDVQNHYGFTPLMLSIEKGTLEISKYLIMAGADVNLQDHFGNTPLMKTVESGNLELLDFIIQKGGDLSIKNNQNQTAYDLARETNQPEMADQLYTAMNPETIQEDYEVIYYDYDEYHRFNIIKLDGEILVTKRNGELLLEDEQDKVIRMYLLNTDYENIEEAFHR
jgi:ankyrin repeat protein